MLALPLFSDLRNERLSAVLTREIGQPILIDGGQSVIMPNTGDFRERRAYRFGQGYVPGLK